MVGEKQPVIGLFHAQEYWRDRPPMIFVNEGHLFPRSVTDLTEIMLHEYGHHLDTSTYLPETSDVSSTS